MKRSELVQKLINEGLSEKTLVNLSDKQLGDLAERMLTEQEVGGQNWGKGGTLIRLPKGSNNTNDAIRIQSDLRGDKYSVVISVQSNKKVRSEIKGDTIFKTVESMLGNKFQEEGDWAITSGIVDSNTYNKIVKLLSSLGVDQKNNTFVTQVNEADVMISKKDPLANQKIEDAIKQNKSIETYEEDMKEDLKGNQKKLDKNHNGKIDGQDFKILKGQKKEVKEGKKCDSCGESVKDCKCDHTHMDESKKIKKWVNTLAEENFHSFTSKNEIMELINIKLNESEVHQYGPNVKTGHNGLPEFMTYEAIVGNGPKIAPSKPKVDPGTKPNKPKTPFQPGPKVNPNPKALGEDNPKIAPSKPKVDPGTKPSKPKTPFQPGPKVNPNPKATTKGDKK
jgi:hypothetical protein